MSLSEHEPGQTIVIGAGPAGLSAAYELARNDIQPIVFEQDDIVGGISRTQCYKGYHFDMGGHRFFTKSKEVNRMWREVLGEAFLLRPRLSRIYYESKFYSYPPQMMNAFRGFGLVKSVDVVASYVRWQMFPHRKVETFEHWVTNAFGRRLFQIFFKTYTEKVWGMGCDELRAEWAAQRIKNLSLRTVALNMVKKGAGKAKSLIEQFHYPRQGPGMMWRAFSDHVEAKGGRVHLNTSVDRIEHEGGRVTAVAVTRDGQQDTVPVDQLYSSTPVTTLIRMLSPQPPAEIMKAADTLRYRDFLTVCLILDKDDLFPDNWIYIHDSAVQVGRIQNFKNWSPHMVPDQKTSSLGLEYFCNQGDELWTKTDAELIELASNELETIGLASKKDVTDGVVYRIPYAYPVYDADYRDALDTLKDYLETFENLQTVGRNGLHRYNNQDHSMLTGVYAVRNVLGQSDVDVWKINGEDDYHEEIVEHDK
ncbi:MAG: NAD(P)/FAD-dependent oxidoreductase [Alphaproteobacteria bacterium]